MIIKLQNLDIQETQGNTSCFSEENKALLSTIMTEQFVRKGWNLFWEGDATGSLFYIKNGNVITTKSTQEGKELRMYTYHSGDLLGHVDLFQTGIHHLTAEVVEDSIVGVISQNDLENLVRQNSSFSIELMKWMGLNHSLTQMKMRDLMLYGKQGALASTLIRMSNSYGKRQGQHIVINKKITHAELGIIIGATRESVNRILMGLRNSGIIEIQDGLYIIKNLSELQEICHCEGCPSSICRL